MDEAYRRATALRALIVGLCSLTTTGGRRVQLSDFCATEDLPAVRDFVRIDASETKIRSKLDRVAGGVRDFLVRRGDVVVTAELRVLADIAFGGAWRQSELPSFVDPVGLEQRRYAGYGSLPAFLNGVEGCWRLYRKSSETSGDRVNRSFLNIKPARVLQSESKAVAEFALYSRDDSAATRRDSGTVKTTGVLFGEGGRLYFVGGRLEDNTERLVALVLDAHAATDTSGARRNGLLMTPSSHGAQIAAPCVARFATESASLPPEKYPNFLAQELEHCDSFAADDPQIQLTANDTEWLSRHAGGVLVMD